MAAVTFEQRSTSLHLRGCWR